MKHSWSLLLAACLLFAHGQGSLTAHRGVTPPDEIFPKKCLPFADLSKPHPIDAQCSPSGLTSPDSDGDTDPNHLQNRAKNNLCAPDPVVRVTISIFDDLQAAAEENGITFGNQHIAHPRPLPADRSVLKNLAKNDDGAAVGEGTKVTFATFVLKTKPGGSESVNCHLTGSEANDIHIVLGRKPPSSGYGTHSRPGMRA